MSAKEIRTLAANLKEGAAHRNSLQGLVEAAINLEAKKRRTPVAPVRVSVYGQGGGVHCTVRGSGGEYYAHTLPVDVDLSKWASDAISELELDRAQEEDLY